jgi:hypothetical protein
MRASFKVVDKTRHPAALLLPSRFSPRCIDESAMRCTLDAHSELRLVFARAPQRASRRASTTKCHQMGTTISSPNAYSSSAP